MEQKIKTGKVFVRRLRSELLSTAFKNLKARSHTLTIPQIHADFWPQHEKCSWNPGSSLEYWFLQGFPWLNWRPVRGQIPPVCKEIFRTMLCLLAEQIYLCEWVGKKDFLCGSLIEKKGFCVSVRGCSQTTFTSQGTLCFLLNVPYFYVL